MNTETRPFQADLTDSGRLDLDGRLTIPAQFPVNAPGVLANLAMRLTAYYVNPAGTLPSLNAANGSTRQQRSSRRRDCIRFLQAMLINLDLVTLRCGIPTEQGFVPLTIKTLAKRAGLPYYTAERVMRDLKRAGLVAVTQLCQVDDLGNFRGIPAIKSINKGLFGVFGLARMLERARKSAYKRLKTRAFKSDKPTSLADLLRVKLFLDAQPSQHRKGSASPHSPSKDHPRHKKRQAEVLLELKSQHPDWTDPQLISAYRAVT